MELWEVLDKNGNNTGEIMKKSIKKSLIKIENDVTRAQANIVNNTEEIMSETANKSVNIHKDTLKTLMHHFL